MKASRSKSLEELLTEYQARVERLLTSISQLREQAERCRVCGASQRRT
jgi:hypothetical protein